MYITQPELTLGNNCAYSINDNQIQINIDEIHNNRQSGNLSGTLSIELWALNQPYQGYEFSNGYCMASTIIGVIFGEHFIRDCQYTLQLENPAEGAWNLCLMLREYNGEIYETIDYRNFEIPYFVEAQSFVVNEEPQTTETVETTEVTETIETDDTTDKISLNSAKETEIAQVKGVSKKLAKLISSNRPFNSIEELMKLKGVGKKLIDKMLEKFKI